MNTNYNELIAYLNRGDLNAELSSELAELVKMVRLTGKQGTINLKLKVAMANKRDEDTMTITPQITTSLPQLDQATAIMFSTADGDLLKNDPKQHELDLKEIRENNQPLKEAI